MVLGKITVQLIQFFRYNEIRQLLSHVILNHRSYLKLPVHLDVYYTHTSMEELLSNGIEYNKKKKKKIKKLLIRLITNY